MPNNQTVYDPDVAVGFSQPGLYSAELWIQDDSGKVDVDFCKIKVYTKGNIEKSIPAVFICHEPSRAAQPKQSVSFKFWVLADLADIPIDVDFGDGTKKLKGLEPFQPVKHQYAKTGIFVVTASALYNGLTLTQKQKVIVGP